MSSITPKCSEVPRPVGPITPKPWASSIRMRKLYFFFKATMPARSPKAPVIPYTPSVMTRMPPPVLATTSVATFNFFSKSSMLLWRYLYLLPMCKRMPSSRQA